MTQQLRLETVESTIRLVGELDLASRDAFTAEVLKITAGLRSVVLDLDSLTFIDAAGLTALIALEHHLRDEERVLVLKRPCALVKRVLDLTGLTWLLETRADESTEAARATLPEI